MWSIFTKDKDIKSIISKRDYNTRKGEFKFIKSSNSINANIAEETDEYLLNPLYYLNGVILLKDENSFIINGKLAKDENIEDFSEGNVTMILNDVEGRKKFICEIKNTSYLDYFMKCDLNVSIIDAKLDEAFCYGEKQNLIIEMEAAYKNMNFTLNGTNINKRSKSSNKGLSVGAIIGIILPCIVVLLIGITIGFIYLTKPKPPFHVAKESGEGFDSGMQMNEW